MTMLKRNVTMQRWHVAVDGNDQWSGLSAAPNAAKSDGPFATLTRARAALRQWRRTGGSGPGEVTIGGGTYRLTESLVLGPEDSGTAEAPVVWRAADGQEVRLSGGVTLTAADLAPVSDPAVAAKLHPDVRAQVRQIELAPRGVSIAGPFTTLGFGFPDIPADPEVYADDRPLRVSRWPKEGYLKIGEVVEVGETREVPSTPSWPWPPPGGTHDSPSPRTAIFTCEEPRMAGWDFGRGIGAFGYWLWDWAPSRHPLASVTGDRVTLAEATFYGVKRNDGGQGGRFYFLNVLEELAEPGEYCLDRRSGILYLVPPAGTANGRILLSLLEKPLVVVQGASHVRLQGLILEGCRGDAFAVADGMDNVLSGCVIRNCGGKAGAVAGVHNRVERCHLHDLGQGGVYVEGGDRRTLTAACNRVEDCDIHDYGRLNPCYHPGVNLNGVGHRVRHNHIHHAPHFAIWAHGNDHLVEFNEIDRVCLDTSDTGAFYIGRNMSERGVMVRHNYFHHIGSGLHNGESAIYFDDGALGSAVGNVFFKAGTVGHARMGAVFIHMGK
ncbi:MAG: right-handed parallel beta-helix repeat-containing protein, partial [Hyphomicrobiales bacterium]